MTIGATTSLSAQSAQKSFTRDDAAKIIAEAHKTVTPEGGQRLGKVALGTQES